MLSYAPSTALGIDVDESLIKRARRKLNDIQKLHRDRHHKDVLFKHCNEHDTFDYCCPDCLKSAEIPVSSAIFEMNSAALPIPIPDSGAQNLIASDRSHVQQQQQQPSLKKLYSVNSMVVLAEAFEQQQQQYQSQPVPSRRQRSQISTVPNRSETILYYGALDNCRFMCDDILSPAYNTPECSGTFDVILCLSLTKWIQLNWGDDAVRELFRRCFNLLTPGGMMVMEPQPTSTYKKCARLSDVHRYNFKNMKFYPENYSDYIMKTVGFRREIMVGSVESRDPRPLYLYIK